MGENNSGCIEGTIGARDKNEMREMSQEEISSAEKQEQKSQVIENPCTQIFKFIHPKNNLCEKSFLGNNKSDLVRCPDYESDEFADVEDNAKDSSSDNNEFTSDMRGMFLVEQDVEFFPKGRDVDEQGNESMERISTEFPDSSEIDLLKDVSSASHLSQSYNIGASCSYTQDPDPKQIPDFTGPAKSEENVKLEMPTIAEIADLSHRMSPKDNKSSRHKPNPLKMKTKVGMSKDKCNVCRVRLGLCAIRCRCGGYYCHKHRYDKEHNCTFDYKSMGAEEIRKNNPKVVAEKVRKL